MFAAAARLLLQDDQHDSGPDRNHEDYHADDLLHDYGDGDTLDLRIAAIFVVLVAGFIGGIIPLLFKSLRDPSKPAAMLLRSLAAGVILALALIHVIPEGNAELEDLVDYPVGPCCVIFGVLVMIIVDNMSRYLLAHMHSGWPSHGHAYSHDAKLECSHEDEHEAFSPSASAIRLGESLQPHDPTSRRKQHDAQELPAGYNGLASTHEVQRLAHPLSPSTGSLRLGEGLPPFEHQRRAASAQSLPDAASSLQQALPRGGNDALLAARRSTGGGGQHSDGSLLGHHFGVPTGNADQAAKHADVRHASNVAVCAVSGVPMCDSELSAACAREHSHGCIAVATAANFAEHADFALATSRLSAHLFELACLVHNVLIGFALGVMVNGRGEVTALLVAFLFHQLLEGIGLGTVIAKGFVLTAGSFKHASAHLSPPGAQGGALQVQGFAASDAEGACACNGAAAAYGLARTSAHLGMRDSTPTSPKAGALKESSTVRLSSLGLDGKPAAANGSGLHARLIDMLHTEAFKAVAMVFFFSMMMPVGIAIGIGVASSYDPDSNVSKAVQGVLSAFSGGLLLYIALVQVVTEDFTKTNGEMPGGWVVRISSYLLLAVGAAAMAVIAIFESA